MFSLPAIDYSPLVKKFAPTLTVRKKLHVKQAWLPDSEYVGNHPPFSLGGEEVERAARLYQFAVHNGFGFIGNLPGILPFPRSDFHSLTTLNFTTMITYGIIIRLETGWLEVGELRLDDATYNSKDTRFTYAKITLAQKLPDLTLDSHNAGLPVTSFRKPVYQTESSEFNRHFTLHLDKSQAHAGLKILSPDVMAILIDHFSQFDIEMRGHTISLITYKHDLVDPATLENLLKTIALLGGELSYQVRQPVGADSLPADIESYKKLHGYSERSKPLQYKVTRLMLGIVLVPAAIVTAFLFVEWLIETIFPGTR